VKSTYLLLTCALLFLLCTSFERQAHAYVDPGSSLLVFQTLSAAVTGVIFYLRKRLKNLLTRSKTAEVDLDVKPR
jgi:FtsH-binding integral membrane protein